VYRRDHQFSRILLVFAIGAGLAYLVGAPGRPKASTQILGPAPTILTKAMEREPPNQCLRAPPRASEDGRKTIDRAFGEPE